MEVVVNVVQGKLRLFLGMVKDHASIGKAIVSSSLQTKCSNIPREASCCFPDIEVAVLRATSHDNGSIDDRHVHQILFLASSSPEGATPFLAERISCRLAKTTDPLVALKSLLLVHRLLRWGNRCFEQKLHGAYLSGHLQMTTLRNVAISEGSFLHSYAAYLEERIGWLINDDGKLEPVVGSFRGMHFRDYDGKSIDLVFRQLPKCQVYIDRVLDLDFLPCNSLAPDINNIVQAAFINVLKESFQVYAAYSEGIAGLISLFFDLTKQARALACEILRRASLQSQELHDLYEKCKQVTGNNSYGSSTNNLNHHKNMKYPFVQIITMDHVTALELCSSPYSYIADLTPPSCNSSVALDHEHKGGPFPASSTTNRKVARRGDANNSSFSSSTLFSWKLETKISKVWVVFEDE